MMLKSALVVDPSDNVDEYAEPICAIVTAELDKEAPERLSLVTTKSRPCDQFLSAGAIQAKCSRRRLEKLWIRTNDENISKQYREAYRRANCLINQSRKNYLTQQINSVRGNCRKRWQEYMKLLHNSNSTHTNASNHDIAQFCTKMSEFFIDKVNKLNTSITSFLQSQTRDPFTADQPHTGSTLSTFSPVTPAEVIKLIQNTKLKLSPVDSFPSTIIKSCSQSFSIIISHLANISLTRGHFPTCFKTAQINPFSKNIILIPRNSLI